VSVRLLAFSIAAAVLVPCAAARPSATHVTIAASAVPWMVAGDRLGVRGTVTPHPSGIQLTLQQWYGSGWKSLTDGAVRADGGFTFSLRPDKAGSTAFRVVTAKGTDFSGASDRVPVKVFKWSYMGNITAFQYVDPLSGEVSLEPNVSNGVHYDHAVSMDAGCYNQWSGSAWADFPLQRLYERFTATVGLGGGATTGSTATYRLVGGDGKQLASGSLTFGAPAQKISVSLEGEYRLRMWINVPDPTGAGGCSNQYTQVVFGDAKLLGP